MSSSSKVKEFTKEVALMMRLRHPNIVRFLGAVVTPRQVINLQDIMGGWITLDTKRYLYPSWMVLSHCLLTALLCCVSAHCCIRAHPSATHVLAL